MSLKDKIASKSAGLVRREKVMLPMCEIEVQVRGLMGGEVQRVSQAKRQEDTQIALSAEDPETGKPIWNPNDLNDLNAIAVLHTVDQAAIIKKGNELSGMDTLGKLFSPSSESGSSPSLSSSTEPSGS